MLLQGYDYNGSVSRFIIQPLIFLLPLFFWPSPLKFELAKIALFLSAGFFLVLYLLTSLNLKNFESHFKKLDKLPRAESSRYSPFKFSRVGRILDVFRSPLGSLKSFLGIHSWSKRPRYSTNDYKIWLLWVGILFLSTLINQSFPYGFLEGGYRHQSVIFFFLLGLFALVAKKLDAKIVLKWATAAIIIETLITYAQWLAIKFNFPILSYNQRPIGTIGEPNAVAGFLILGIPIIITFLPQPLIPVLAVILATVLTGSKAGILAVIAELVVFGFLWKKKLPYRKLLLIFSLILIIVIGTLGVYLERNESPFENRWLIWNLGLKAIQEKPILGYGAEGIVKVYDQEFRQINLTLEELAVDRSHNLFLDISLFSGIIGFVVFGLWLWRATQKLLKKESWVLASLVGFLVFSFFQPVGVTHWFYLIILISLTNI